MPFNYDTPRPRYHRHCRLFATAPQQGRMNMPFDYDAPRPRHHRRPRGSYFRRGGVKFAILELLKEQPRHGYDIMREIEDRSDGVYSPSPGVIYPTLQALGDQDYVKSNKEEGKKVYTITESGLAFLEGQKELMQKRYGRGRHREAAPGHPRSGRPMGRPGGRGPGADGEPAEDRFSEETSASGRYHGRRGRRGDEEEQGRGWERRARGAGGGFGAWVMPEEMPGEMPDPMQELRWFFTDFADSIQQTVTDPEKIKEIRQVLGEAERRIDEIVMR